MGRKERISIPTQGLDAPRILSHNKLSGVNQAENEFIRVKVNPDGTVNITDKQTGEVYEDLDAKDNIVFVKVGKGQRYCKIIAR